MRVLRTILLLVLFGSFVSADTVKGGPADGPLHAVPFITAGSLDEPVYLRNVETMKPSQLQKVFLTAGNFDEPVYIERGIVLTTGTANKPDNVLPKLLATQTVDVPVYLSATDVPTANTADVPAYLKTDVLTAGTNEKSVYLQEVNLVAGTVDEPMYLKSNVLTAGTNDNPVYLHNTALTAGTADDPVYLESSKLPTATANLSKLAVMTARLAGEPTDTVAVTETEWKAITINEPVYLKSAALTAGTADKPVYLNQKVSEPSSHDDPAIEVLTAGFKGELTYSKATVLTVSSADEPVSLSEAVPISRSMLQDCIASTFKTIFGKAMSFAAFLEKTLMFATNESGVTIAPDILVEHRQQALTNELPVFASAGTLEEHPANAEVAASASTVGASEEPVRGSGASTLGFGRWSAMPMYLHGQQAVATTAMKSKAEVIKGLASRKIRQPVIVRPVSMPRSALAAAAGTAKAGSVACGGNGASAETKVAGAAVPVEGPSQPSAFGRASSILTAATVAPAGMQASSKMEALADALALALRQAESVVAVGSVNDTAVQPLAAASASVLNKAAIFKAVPQYLQSGKPLQITALKSKDMVLKGLALKNRKLVIETAAKAEVAGVEAATAGTVEAVAEKLVLVTTEAPRRKVVPTAGAVNGAVPKLEADSVVDEKPIAQGSVQGVPQYLQNGRIPVATAMKKKDDVLRGLLARKVSSTDAAVNEQPIRRRKMRRLQSVEA